MTRSTLFDRSGSPKTARQRAVLLIVRSAAYLSLAGTMADGTLQKRVLGWLQMLPASSIGLLREWLQQYGGSCVIAMLVVLLLRWAWKLT